MNQKSVTTCFNDALFIAQSLFERNKASGSSANMSFRCEDAIYITGSGTCFGTLTQNDFSVVTFHGEHLDGPKPSKEFELHRSFYTQWDSVGAVIHCHSPYGTLWSCLKHADEKDIVPAFTPYLRMKLGKIALIPYAHPGTKELFDLFKERVHSGKGFLLQNHGPIVAGKSLLETFYALEELEESIKIAWFLRNQHDAMTIPHVEELEQL